VPGLGVDLGIKDFAVTSVGERFANRGRPRTADADYGVGHMEASERPGSETGRNSPYRPGNWIMEMTLHDDRLGRMDVHRNGDTGPNKKGRQVDVPLHVSTLTSGQRRFAVLGSECHDFIVSDGGKRVVFGLEPYELGLQVTDTLLQAPHLRNHAGVRTADVAE
jgi:hypothetical protein